MNYKFKLLLLGVILNGSIIIQAMDDDRRQRVIAFEEQNMPNRFENPLVNNPNFGVIEEDQAQGTAFNPDQNIQINGPVVLFNNEDKK